MSTAPRLGRHAFVLGSARGFNQDCQNHGQFGGVLLWAIVASALMVVVFQLALSRVNQSLKVLQSQRVRSERAQWAEFVGSRIDCVRTLAGYTKTNRCPPGTALAPVYFDSAPLSPGNPDQSYSLGQNWYAKLSCGNGDLQLRLAKFKTSPQAPSGAFSRDPLTQSVLDFSHPSTLVTDKPGRAQLCPEYFGDGTPDVRMIGMSILTQTYWGASPTATGQLQGSAVTCDGYLGLPALVDDFPLDPMYRKVGSDGLTPASWTPTAVWINQIVRPWYTDYGGAWAGNLQMNFPQPSHHTVNIADSLCDTICTAKFNASAGKLTKCDPSVTDSPPFKEIAVDSSVGQVNCMCLR